MGQDGLKADQFADGCRSFCHATDFWLVPWSVLAVLRRHIFQLENPRGCAPRPVKPKDA
ncbi:hypothetical protein N8524_06575 [Candidatus Puniceispirillum sp.]|nr:hypothetical protein [Candidatus Puniceispirillum sp.]